MTIFKSFILYHQSVPFILLVLALFDQLSPIGR